MSLSCVDVDRFSVGGFDDLRLRPCPLILIYIEVCFGPTTRTKE